VENFTPVSGMVGGAMIGLAASVLLLGSGRIAGISGILGGLLGADGKDTWWRLVFVLGLVGGALAVGFAAPAKAAITVQASWPLLVLAGLLVGFGTRLGQGCTSGHGVCGLARLSPRSIVATAVFFVTAAATVFVLRHLLGGDA
jgi:uncharacterized membrane protein YedE/YeeE